MTRVMRQLHPDSKVPKRAGGLFLSLNDYDKESKNPAYQNILGMRGFYMSD